MNQMYYIQKINEIVSFKGEIMIQHKFGLYEKALPRDLALSEKLRIAKDLGFDYFELSTDESEEFQARVTSDTVSYTHLYVCLQRIRDSHFLDKEQLVAYFRWRPFVL